MAPRRTYDAREKDIALTAFALSHGSGAQEKVYMAILAEENLAIPLGTARTWANRTMRERYLQIREEVGEITRAQVADDATKFAATAAGVVQSGLEWLQELIDNREIDPKQLPKAIKEAAVAHGIGVDKAEKLNDRPSARIAIDFEGTLRNLQDMGMEVIDGEAEEEPDLPALPAPTT